MLAFMKNAVEKELKTISPADHREHGSILCSSWPAAQAALTTAGAMVKGFWVRLAITVATLILSGLVKKFCPGNEEAWYDAGPKEGTNG